MSLVFFFCFFFKFVYLFTVPPCARTITTRGKWQPRGRIKRVRSHGERCDGRRSKCKSRDGARRNIHVERRTGAGAARRLLIIVYARRRLPPRTHLIANRLHTLARLVYTPSGSGARPLGFPRDKCPYKYVITPYNTVYTAI